MRYFLCAAGLLLAATTVVLAARAQDRDVPAPTTLRLWPGEAPGAKGTEDVDIPSITIYSPPQGKANGAAIVVCPGGGYGGLAAHEGKPVAEWLNSLGVTGIVLKYRLGPRYHNPVMMHDVARAIRMARAKAKDWKIDPKRIGVLGFSAGGHLASTAATHFDEGDPQAADLIDRVSSRPDAAMLIYPVITMSDPYTHAGSRNNLLGDKPTKELVDLMSNEKQVTARTPPTFLVHTSDDGVVPAENSLLYALACRKAHVPVEIHVYEHGPHGFGMAAKDPVLGSWPGLCAKWLDKQGFLGP